jgi:hypothetical protein
MRLVSIDVGHKNLAFVVARHERGTFDVASWRCVDVGARAGASKTDVVASVLAALDALGDELLECETVLIEAQPRFAPLNAMIAQAVAAYFVLRKRVDLDEPVAVHFVAAALKNRLCAASLPAARACTSAITGAAVTRKYAKYTNNKRAAVAACAALVARSESAALAAAWAAFAKKDDAADCLLQAVAWTGASLDGARVRWGRLPEPALPHPNPNPPSASLSLEPLEQRAYAPQTKSSGP